ncbi:MAG: FG-GAP repeat protein, partial [Candidatus Cloacimonetes bacterium]|nr:FG-GAP repeat protein [Candidatus Cloacimonadota bacterium]
MKNLTTTVLKNSWFKIFFILIICLFFVTTGLPANWADEFKITASDGDPTDFFGCSVSIDGDYAIIGSASDNVTGLNSGSAYIFHRNGTTWTEQQKLTASDSDGNDNFGYSVSIDGDYAIIGARYDEENGEDAGSAYIFHRTGSTWTEQQKLTAADGGVDDHFGISVCIDSDYAIIGAREMPEPSTTSGSAYIFHRSGTTWTEQQKLTASDGGDGELFGVSVYIDGEYAIIGAQQDDDNGSASGSAYIFHRSGTTWTEQQKLTAADGASGDKFGTSVCIDGEYAIIGAELDDDNGTDTGSAYIFDRSGTTWTEQQKLTAADGGVDDYFGTSVYINDDFVYIGAEGSGSDTGSTHIYHRSGTTWSEQQKLTAADGAGGDHFGNSVCFGDKYAIIGAQRDDDNGSASGSAYLYRAVNYWDGSVSDVWQNDNNWTLKHVPTLDEDVVITSDGFHPPYISSSTAYCRDIEFESGASLNQNGGYFRIFGDFNSDDGTFTQSSSGYLYFDGDSDTSWDDNNEDDTYYNVRVDKNISTAGVNMWQDMTVNTSFEIREGVFGINEEWTLNITGIGEPALQVEDGGKLRLNDEEIIVAGGIEFEDGSQLETGTNSVIRCGRNFRVEANTAYDIVFGQNSWLYMNGSSDQYIQDLDGGNLELAGLYITNNTGCVYIANEDLFIEGALNLDGNFSCKSSPSSSTVHDIYISSGWFEHDYADFEESTGRVIFNGGYLSRCWDGEFYELEIAKDSGQVFYVSDGGIIECDYLDWTSGSIEVEDGTFTANDLMDNGIYGNYILHPDGIINLHQDSGSYIDFNGSLNISGGIMNVYGGGYTSYWPYLTDATIEMSDGILDFHDHGIDIRNSGSNTLTENITGGTIRTAFGFEGDRSDFNPTGGTIELYGSTDAEINIGEGSNFFHVEINKNTKRDKKNELTTKKDREGNLIKTSKSNTITATSNLDINGSFIINSGIFAAPDTMWVAGDWVNNLDETAFQEGEGRVILDGSISWCYSEIFNDLEINKDDTYLFIPVSNVVSCSTFTFETGKLQVDGGIFTADDLSQNGIFGWYELDNEGEINLYQDDSYLIDLNGNIYIDSGTMNVYGGVTTSFWPSSRDASIIMSGGTLNFHDNGIFIRNSASYSFSEDISGGTIRTAGSFTGERSDFNPSGGTIELYGSDDVELSTGEGSNLYNLHIDKTAVKESLTDKKYSIKTDREGKTRKIKRANTVDALNNLDIDGNFTLNNGTFTAPDTMWVAGNWTNNVGDAAFAEGTGRVIFDGDAVQYCSSEIFNDLELNKSFGYLRSNSGANITCENYDWTAGGLLITGTSSSFLANDLEDSGLYGTLEVHDDCTIDLHQDTGQFIDLNGYLKIYGGTMNVYGGASPSWWTADDNASITMSGGTLDFHDNGIHIYNSGNDLTEDITGGIIRTAHSFTGNRSDFNPEGGIIELYGSADATISMGDGSSFYNVNIDKAAKTNPKDSNTKEYVIVNNRDGTKTRYARANTINANSNLDITGDFTLETGSFTIGANSMNVTDSVNVYGTFTMGSSDASLSCENMNWFSGSVAEISDGTISVSGHWLFEDDIEAQFTTANTVNFTGDGNQFIYYRDDDSEFGNINCNQTSGSVWLHSSSTDTMRVAGDMTMLERSFHIQSEDLLVEGILDIQTGTDIDLAGSGSLTNNSPFTLNGELDVNLGDVYINGDFEMAVTGILQIDGGSFNVN